MPHKFVDRPMLPEDNVRAANEMAFRFAADAPIRGLAMRIIGQTDNVFRDGPPRIARWIVDNVRYGQESPGIEVLQGPYTTLPPGIEIGDFRFGGIGVGDCDDLALLFATLCRAAGIEAFFAGVAELPYNGSFVHAIGYCAANQRFYELSKDEPYGGLPNKPLEMAGVPLGQAAFIYDPVTKKWHRFTNDPNKPAHTYSVDAGGMYDAGRMGMSGTAMSSTGTPGVSFVDRITLPDSVVPFAGNVDSQVDAAITGARTVLDAFRGNPTTVSGVVSAAGAALAAAGVELTDITPDWADAGVDIASRGFQSYALIAQGAAMGGVVGAGIAAAVVVGNLAGDLARTVRNNRDARRAGRRISTDHDQLLASFGNMTEAQRHWCSIRFLELVPYLAGTRGAEKRNGQVLHAKFGYATTTLGYTWWGGSAYRDRWPGIDYLCGEGLNNSPTCQKKLASAHENVSDTLVRTITQSEGDEWDRQAAFLLMLAGVRSDVMRQYGSGVDTMRDFSRAFGESYESWFRRYYVDRIGGYFRGEGEPGTISFTGASDLPLRNLKIWIRNPHRFIGGGDFGIQGRALPLDATFPTNGEGVFVAVATIVDPTNTPTGTRCGILDFPVRVAVSVPAPVGGQTIRSSLPTSWTHLCEFMRISDSAGWTVQTSAGPVYCEDNATSAWVRSNRGDVGEKAKISFVLPSIAAPLDRSVLDLEIPDRYRTDDGGGSGGSGTGIAIAAGLGIGALLLANR